MTAAWKVFLDETASPDARADAWRTLRRTVYTPVLLQMRRCMKGYRRTEQLADEFCDKLCAEHEGRGLAVARFRLLVVEELDRFLNEIQVETEIGEEFDRDWASGLLHAALKALERRDPGAHLLLLRAYDRPEGAPPYDAAQLARKLRIDPDEIDEAIERGRAEVHELFRAEIARTVCDPDCVAAEVHHLEPFARAFFARESA